MDPEAQHPKSVLPYLPEIEAFAKHTYHYVVYRILKLVSLALELPEDYLWGLHDQNGTIGAASQRYMGYFPRSEEHEVATAGTWSKGHTDCTSPPTHRSFIADFRLQTTVFRCYIPNLSLRYRSSPRRTSGNGSNTSTAPSLSTLPML